MTEPPGGPMQADLAQLTEAALEAARRAGADAADVIAIDGTSTNIDVRGGALEQAERSEGVDLGLRVLLGQRQASVSVSETSAAAITMMAERAVAMAREAPEDPYCGLANPADLATEWDIAALELFDPTPEPAPADLQEDARRAEAAAQSITGVTQVQAASAGYSSRRVHLAASNGFSGGYSRTDRATSCVAISGEGTGMERDYASEVRIFSDDLPDPESIGTLAGARAVARAGARKPPTGAFPVLYDERISSGLIGHVLQATNGAAIARGSSWLRDRMGETILPKGLSITENPLRPRASSSRPFDAEGLPTQVRDIVAEGVLQGWTLDLASARKLGLTSTANAARGTSGPPSPSLTNVALTQGDQSLDDLIAQMGTGLWATSLIGSSINATTGDYSRGASGFWVENGEVQYPVNECTIAGNLHEMIASIIPANDARTHLSRVVPSLLIEGLTLAGE